MKKILIFLIYFCGSSMASAAIVTSTLNGEVLDCAPGCVATGGFSGGTIQFEFTFEDSFLGTTITDVNLADLSVTTEVAAPAPGFTTVPLSLTAANLNVDGAGNIISGTASALQNFGGLSFLYELDLAGFFSPAGTAVSWTVYSGTDYLSGGCLEGYGCNPVPLPTGIWLFGTALAGLAGFRLTGDAHQADSHAIYSI